MRRSFEAGAPVTLPAVNTIADSLAAPPMALPYGFAACRRYVGEIVTVSDAEIRGGMRALFEDLKLALEPAGAAATAALLGPLRDRPGRLQGRRRLVRIHHRHQNPSRGTSEPPALSACKAVEAEQGRAIHADTSRPSAADPAACLPRARQRQAPLVNARRLGAGPWRLGLGQQQKSASPSRRRASSASVPSLSSLPVGFCWTPSPTPRCSMTMCASVSPRLPKVPASAGALQLCHNQSGLRDYFALAMLHGASPGAGVQRTGGSGRDRRGPIATIRAGRTLLLRQPELPHPDGHPRAPGRPDLSGVAAQSDLRPRRDGVPRSLQPIPALCQARPRVTKAAGRLASGRQ